MTKAGVENGVNSRRRIEQKNQQALEDFYVLLSCGDSDYKIYEVDSHCSFFKTDSLQSRLSSKLLSKIVASFLTRAPRKSEVPRIINTPITR